MGTKPMRWSSKWIFSSVSCTQSPRGIIPFLLSERTSFPLLSCQQMALTYSFQSAVFIDYFESLGNYRWSKPVPRFQDSHTLNPYFFSSPTDGVTRRRSLTLACLGNRRHNMHIQKLTYIYFFESGGGTHYGWSKPYTHTSYQQMAPLTYSNVIFTY